MHRVLRLLSAQVCSDEKWDNENPHRAAILYLRKEFRFATLGAWNQFPLYGMRVDGRSSLQLAGA